MSSIYIIHIYIRYTVFAFFLPAPGSTKGLFEFQIDRCDCLLSAGAQDAVDEGQSCVFGQDFLGVCGSSEDLFCEHRRACVVVLGDLRERGAPFCMTTDWKYSAGRGAPIAVMMKID